MKNTYYFSHDTNASRDEKILSMRVDYGWEGYGWYWAIVETMAEANNYKLKFRNSNPNGVANRVAMMGLSLCHSIQIEKLEKFIDDCIKKYDLFTSDGEYFWSKTLLKRLSIRDEKTSKLRDAGIKGAGRRWGTNNHPNGDVIATPMTTPMARKGKKRKEKEIKIINKEEQTPVINKPEEKTEPLEFNFKDKCWDGLDDWRIKMFQGKFPMLSINSLLNDNFKQKFLSKPKEYEELIKTKYKGKIEDLVWAWLGQAWKFYLKDHPEYKQEPVETVNKLGRNMSQIGDVIKDLNIKKEGEN